MVSGPCVPGGDGLLVTLGHGQLGGLFGGEQPDLLVLVAENRGAAGGHEGSPSVSGALGFLNVARAAYRLPWLSGSAESTICRFTSAVCRLTVDALPGRSPRCVQPSRWLPACWPRTTSTPAVPMLKLG